MWHYSVIWLLLARTPHPDPARTTVTQGALTDPYSWLAHHTPPLRKHKGKIRRRRIFIETLVIFLKGIQRRLRRRQNHFGILVLFLRETQRKIRRRRLFLKCWWFSLGEHKGKFAGGIIVLHFRHFLREHNGKIRRRRISLKSWWFFLWKHKGKIGRRRKSLEISNSP